MSKKNSTTIEINGKTYDAVTGAPLSGQPRSIDGVVRATHTPERPSEQVVVVAAQAHPVAAKKVMDVKRSAHHIKPHETEHAKTLMRAAVQRPAPQSLKPHHLSAQTRTDVLAKSPNVAVTPKFSFNQVDPLKLKRAKHVTQSQLITRFASGTDTNSRLTESQQAAAIYVAPVSAAPAPVENHSMDLFERAIAKATAHEEQPVHPRKLARANRKAAKQAAHKPLHHRTVSTLAASALVLAVTGIIAYQDRAQITLRYADAKAGFQASLPGYKPAGFATGKFTYDAGSVAVDFANATSNRNYKITQQTSNWDSQTLLTSFVIPKDNSYQTLQSGGRTIFIYNDNNAVWVDQGILYTVTSNGSLSTSDVLNIAKSL